MTNARKKNTKPTYGHSPDRYNDSQVTAEEPDRREFHRGQEGMNAGMVADVEFTETRPLKEIWKGMPPMPPKRRT